MVDLGCLHKASGGRICDLQGIRTSRLKTNRLNCHTSAAPWFATWPGGARTPLPAISSATKVLHQCRLRRLVLEASQVNDSVLAEHSEDVVQWEHLQAAAEATRKLAEGGERPKRTSSTQTRDKGMPSLNARTNNRTFKPPHQRTSRARGRWLQVRKPARAMRQR